MLGANGKPVAVSGLRLTTTHVGKAYNLEIKDIHTYHVGKDAILVHNRCGTAAKTVALDSSTARAYVTNTPVGAQLRSDLAGCNLVMCSTAHQEWTSAMGRLAGPNEQAWGAQLSSRLTIVADNPSACLLYTSRCV